MLRSIIYKYNSLIDIQATKPIKWTLNTKVKWLDGICKINLLKKWLKSAKVLPVIIQIIDKNYLVEL